MQTIIANQDLALDQLLSRLDKLHSAPTIALRVMQLTRDDDFDLTEVARCLENDPALAASILRLANSSYYGLVDGVTSLPHALAYLGRKSLRLAVLSFALVKTMVNGAPAHFHQTYWKRSLTMGAAARQCAMLINSPEVDKDTAFAAGLLSDLGMLVLAQLETKRYIELSAEPDHLIDLVMREREVLGFDHMAVGARLLVRWEMPPELIEAVANHHTYLPVSPKLNHVLLVANLMTEALWTPASPYMQPLQLVISGQLNMDVDDIITLAVETKAAVLETMEIFGVTVQGDIDLDAMEEQARELYAAAALDSATDPDHLEIFVGL